MDTHDVVTNLRLVKASEEYRSQIIDMMEEWNGFGEKIVPYAIRRLDYRDFENYCNNLEIRDDNGGLIPDSTFFCLDEERNLMVGAVNIRHYLNESLLLNGGHIGDKDNVGSAKSIMNNGGVLENEVEVDGVMEQRYWIDLTKEVEEG